MSVVNKEYEHLQEQIQLLTENWSKQLEDETLTDRKEWLSIQQFPVIPQIKLDRDTAQYRSFIIDLLSLLKKLHPSLSEEISKLEGVLSTEVLDKWFQEAIGVNQFYFEQFAKEHHVAEWLPYFTAEHAIRPFLQKAAVEVKEVLHKAKGHGGCPSCGEPPRLAIVNKNGRKEVSCPRCLHTWEVKKVSCAHCGCEEPGQIEIIKVEKDERAELHVCNRCKGYTKVFDVRKMVKNEALPLLDIKSIHLDYIADEHGYGVPEVKDAH